ncbi:MAG: type II toxin-antitoxin system VapC family toxin [Planctomycetes bacterium]|nr:type II toxin-antitoxin system VapC family toxin [Planctomycetota bacterium]
MIGFLLDTNICIYALKGHRRVLDRLLAADRETVRTSVVTEAELRTGAAKSSAPLKTLRLVENFLRPIEVLPFTSEDAAAYARVRSRLESSGTPIGPLDTFIAAQAVSRRLTLVTNNEREFSRVPGLALENWAR